MGTDIASGVSSATPDPIQPSQPWPAVNVPTEMVGTLSGPTYPARDLAQERLSQLADYQQQISGAQSAGMNVEDGRRAHGQAQGQGPIGDVIGDLVLLPDPPPYEWMLPESNP